MGTRLGKDIILNSKFDLLYNLFFEKLGVT